MAKNVKIAGATYEDVPGVELPLADNSGNTALFSDTSDADATAGDILRGKSAYGASGVRLTGTAGPYAGSPSNGGTANKAMSIPFGQLDSTSTSTSMTAQVDGITELRDGVCVWLMNGVVTSESGYTININNLGAKPVYSSMASATRTATIFNANYTALLVYNSHRVSGGCWDYVYGHDSNTTYTPASLGFSYLLCATSASTPDKIATNGSYRPINGGILAVKFTNAVNRVSGNKVTLNVSGQGAFPILYRANELPSGVIKAGDIATMIYYGSGSSNNYYLIAIDRWQEDITALQNAIADIPEFVSELQNDAGYITNPRTVYASIARPVWHEVPDPTAWVEDAVVNAAAYEAPSAEAEGLIAAVSATADIFVNSPLYLTNSAVIDEDPTDVTYVIGYNIEGGGNSMTGLKRIDTTKGCWAVILSTEPQAVSGYFMSVVATEDFSEPTEWKLFGEGQYLTEHQSLQGLATETWVNTAIQNAIGNAIGGSY